MLILFQVRRVEGEEVTEAEVAQQVSLPVDREMGVLPVSQFLEYFVFELLTRQVCSLFQEPVEQQKKKNLRKISMKVFKKFESKIYKR